MKYKIIGSVSNDGIITCSEIAHYPEDVELPELALPPGTEIFRISLPPNKGDKNIVDFIEKQLVIQMSTQYCKLTDKKEKEYF